MIVVEMEGGREVVDPLIVIVDVVEIILVVNVVIDDRVELDVVPGTLEVGSWVVEVELDDITEVVVWSDGVVVMVEVVVVSGLGEVG